MHLPERAAADGDTLLVTWTGCMSRSCGPIQLLPLAAADVERIGGGWPRSISTRSIRVLAAAISWERKAASSVDRAPHPGHRRPQKRHRRKPRGLPRRNGGPPGLNQDIERSPLSREASATGRAHHRRSRGYEPSPGQATSINPNRPVRRSTKAYGPRTSCATDCARC